MPEHHGIRWTRDALLGLVSLVVIGLAIILGVQLTHGNSDYVCSVAVNDSQQGACANGSWSDWTTANGVSTRTYTGTRTLITFAGRVNGVSCSHPSYNISQATGQTTTEYAACQIVETGTANTAGGNGNPSTVSYSNVTRSESTGAVATSTTNANGSYGDYLNIVDSSIATSSITAVPSVVRQGSTTEVSWTSAYVNSCTVTGSNGDSWPKPVTQTTTDADGNPVETQTTPPATSGDETSSPLKGQTVYTLSCTSKSGRQLTQQQVIVNIIPTYQEL